MDWPSFRDPFLLPKYNDLFDCKGTIDKRHCTVLEVFNVKVSDNIEVARHDLLTEDDWKNWIKNCAVFTDDREKRGQNSPPNLPKDGVCILFVPETTPTNIGSDIDVKSDFTDPDVDTRPSLKSNLTELPLDREKWEKISKAFFLLPEHTAKAIETKLRTSINSLIRSDPNDTTKGLLWMQTARASDEFEDRFAMGSTYIERDNLTLAIFIGCSTEQVDRVKQLLEDSEEAITHPLLMLGICVELLLDRCLALVDKSTSDCLRITMNIGKQSEAHDKGIDWELLKKVRSRGDQSKRIEEEVNATKRQLAKVLPRLFDHKSDLSDDSVPIQRSNVNSNVLKSNNPRVGNSLRSKRSFSGILRGSNGNAEITDMFEEHFNDYITRFEELVAQCRISAEEMANTTNHVSKRSILPFHSFNIIQIRGELALRETNTSASQARMSTVIAFVAMLYLPMTTTATIFAMPVFQFPNKWRDERFNVVRTGNVTSGSASPAFSNIDSDLPVFSGYFWIYLAISMLLSLATIMGWWVFAGQNSIHQILPSAYSFLTNTINRAKVFKLDPLAILKRLGRLSSRYAGQNIGLEPSDTSQEINGNKASSTEESQEEKLLKITDKGTVEQNLAGAGVVILEPRQSVADPGSMV
ncbi:hypothetical protein BS50DRAFT_680375 [Corynespora cassiicola Philippines]|uniref:Cora-domain-containing protein n=1 Tax=Corynespora cassiicola Philippines TaxID=1448308 RepID=A0A2T2N9E7_CORCC|nr:hypothetical protein BS50DRAFT_680375 [Corynespora cassiicola Philippines]